MSENKYMILLSAIIVFFLHVSIVSILVAKTIDFFFKSNSMQNSIKGKSLYAYHRDAPVIASHGGIPIPTTEPFQKYMENKYNPKIDGFVESTLGIIHILNNHKELKSSDIIKTINQIVFPLNKKKTHLLEDINNIIFQIKHNSLLELFCKHNNINNNFIIC